MVDGCVKLRAMGDSRGNQACKVGLNGGETEMENELQRDEIKKGNWWEAI